MSLFLPTFVRVCLRKRPPNLAMPCSTATTIRRRRSKTIVISFFACVEVKWGSILPPFFVYNIFFFRENCTCLFFSYQRRIYPSNCESTLCLFFLPPDYGRSPGCYFQSPISHFWLCNGRRGMYCSNSGAGYEFAGIGLGKREHANTTMRFSGVLIHIPHLDGPMQ